MSFKQSKTILQSVFFIWLLSFGGPTARAQTSADSEEIVYSLVENITEVKAYFHKVDSLYPDPAIKAQIMIVGDPSKETPYYWVQVGVNDGDRLTPQYNFYVYLAKKEVKYLDTMTDQILTLSEWRKRKK